MKRIGKLQKRVLTEIYSYEKEHGKYEWHNKRPCICCIEIIEGIMGDRPVRQRWKGKFTGKVSRREMREMNEKYFREAKSIYRAIKNLENNRLIERQIDRWGTNKTFSLTEQGRRIISHRLK